MAARINPAHDERTRLKIKTSQLINRLMSNALGLLQTEMTSGQVKSAEILLRKTLPDLAATALTDPTGNKPAEIVIRWQTTQPST